MGGLAGSLALGLQFAATGFMFAAVGAVAAQLTSSAGGARGIAVGVLGAAWLLRVAGDVSGQAGGGLGWLSWLSPIGWAHRIRPYAGERWEVLTLLAALTALVTGAAVALSARRDVGVGLLPPRPGPATAAPGLRSPLALAWRLHRGLLAGAIVRLPAVWALAAVAIALIGLLPRLAGAAWAAFAGCLLLGLVGAALQLDQRLRDLSPFTHIPKVPGAGVPTTPLVALVAVAAALAAAGLAALRRRNIPVT